MFIQIQLRHLLLALLISSISGALTIGCQSGFPTLAQTDLASPPPDMSGISQTAPTAEFPVYLPTVTGPPPWISPFGVEPSNLATLFPLSNASKHEPGLACQPGIKDAPTINQYRVA